MASVGRQYLGMASCEPVDGKVHRAQVIGGGVLAAGARSPGFCAVVRFPPVVTAGTAVVSWWEGVDLRTPSCWLSCLTDLPPQDMENKIRSTLNEIYFGKTKDIVNGLR